ncbi:helix-turn-helix domain-containing protein [Mycobacteroides abscessus]|uniref:helix-turn-helix domain-containing protein n=1 Tax=Mycobacteroides abscessus TaxID=36809 RepID=UPI0005DEE77B|nr:helix-turn-helix domain-containing protein [Mycobacteroides abscessus]CPR69466.1 DNA-binding protein [Mycobacteroides abscessus]CPU70639.1 DNA-binding protein [Mycobacteroides abscessus]
MTSPRSLLTLREAAAELRISRTQMYRMRASGRIRVLRLGSRVLVPRREIQRLIDDALAEAPPPAQGA